jgi:hypothetical protein
MPRTVVQLIVPDLSQPWGATATDDDGAYTVARLQRGTVILKFFALGFETLTQEVTVNGNIQLDVKLTPTPTTSGP